MGMKRVSWKSGNKEVPGPRKNGFKGNPAKFQFLGEGIPGKVAQAAEGVPIPGNVPKPVDVALGDPWGHLGTPGDPWGPLGTQCHSPGDSWHLSHPTEFPGFGARRGCEPAQVSQLQCHPGQVSGDSVGTQCPINRALN